MSLAICNLAYVSRKDIFVLKYEYSQKYTILRLDNRNMRQNYWTPTHWIEVLDVKISKRVTLAKLT